MYQTVLRKILYVSQALSQANMAKSYNVDSDKFWYLFFCAKCIFNVAVTYHIDGKNMK